MTAMGPHIHINNAVTAQLEPRPNLSVDGIDKKQTQCHDKAVTRL